MTALLVTLAVGVVLVATAAGYVWWRDRRRVLPDEDGAAARAAEGRKQRYEAERHSAQADTVRRGQDSSTGC